MKADIFKDILMFDSSLFYINYAIEYELTNYMKSNYHVFKCNIYRKTNQRSEALKEVDLAIKIDKNNASAYLNRSFIKKEFFDDINGAKEDLEIAIKLKPNIMDNVITVSYSERTK